MKQISVSKEVWRQLHEMRRQNNIVTINELLKELIRETIENTEAEQ